MATKNEVKTKLRKEGEFIPPDGGWGWAIVFAAGFSNLSTLPTLQQFGLLFRDRFARLGITSSETTTIINMHMALSACVGLLDGPAFKTFSYRQIGLTGTFLIFIALLCATFSYNFATYLISISVLYGIGYGISSSANSLALNFYWKKRRRLATAFSWTATGLGPMIWPQIITVLFEYFGEMGTILLVAGFSLHAIFCALLLYPVEWHSKQPENESLIQINSAEITTKNMKRNGDSSTKLSGISNQNLYNENNYMDLGYDMTDSGIPVVVSTNNSYSQSRQSRIYSREGSNMSSKLPSKKPSTTNLYDENRSKRSSTLYLNESKKNSYANLGTLTQLDRDKMACKPKLQSKRKISINETLIPESEIEDCPTLKAPQDLKAEENTFSRVGQEESLATKRTKLFRLDSNNRDQYNNRSNISNNFGEQDDSKCLKDSNQSSLETIQRRKSNNFDYESELFKQASVKLEQYLQENNKGKDLNGKPPLGCGLNDEVHEEFKILKNNEKTNLNGKAEAVKLNLWEKITIVFDLDLLKDFTFINLVLGLTLASFNELNFSILTPFLLRDYDLTKQQVAIFMTLVGSIDVSVRFCSPFIASKIDWENSSFFLFGVMIMALGRVVLAYSQIYEVVLLVAVMVGFGKGLRTVFMVLVIPTHVPLHKLAGATGLHLLFSGIVYLVLGPVVGYIKDNASTAVTLHCLNIFTWLTAISWSLEKYIRTRRQRLVSEENK